MLGALTEQSARQCERGRCGVGITRRDVAEHSEIPGVRRQCHQHGTGVAAVELARKQDRGFPPPLLKCRAAEETKANPEALAPQVAHQRFGMAGQRRLAEVVAASLDQRRRNAVTLVAKFGEAQQLSGSVVGVFPAAGLVVSLF